MRCLPIGILSKGSISGGMLETKKLKNILLVAGQILGFQVLDSSLNFRFIRGRKMLLTRAVLENWGRRAVHFAVLVISIEMLYILCVSLIFSCTWGGRLPVYGLLHHPIRHSPPEHEHLHLQ